MPRLQEVDSQLAVAVDNQLAVVEDSRLVGVDSRPVVEGNHLEVVGILVDHNLVAPFYLKFAFRSFLPTKQFGNDPMMLGDKQRLTPNFWRVPCL